MGWREYLTGVLWFVGIWGSAAAAAVIVVRRRLAHLDGAPRALAGALIGTLALIAVHVVPASLTVLTRGTALATGLLLVAVALRVPRAAAPATGQGHARTGREVDDPYSRVVAGAVVAIVVVAELSVMRQTWTMPPVGIDALNFHLPDAIGWMRSGSLWRVDQYGPDLANGNYPNNGNVVLLASILPWHADFLVRFALVPFLPMTGLGIFALARELGAPRSAATIFGGAFAAIPAVADDLFSQTLPDVVMTATFATGLLFLVRYSRTSLRADLVLAGLGLGCALGTKWFGASSAVTVVFIWIVASLLARRRFGHVVREAVILLGLLAAAGGIWLVRNLVVSGSPLFPAKVSFFGLTIFDAPRDPIREIAGRRILDYATDGHAWTEYFLPAWWQRLGWLGPLLAAGLLVAIVVMVRLWRRHGSDRCATQALLGCAVAAIALFVVYLATPYSAFSDGREPIFAVVNVRYAEPALLLAAALAARAAGESLVLLRISATLALAAVVEGLHRGLRLGVSDISPQAVFVVATGAAAVVAWRWSSDRLTRGRDRTVWLAAFAVLGTAAVAYGRRFEQSYMATRYVGGPADEVVTWITRNAPSDQRVGLVGVWDKFSPVYPAFGPRFQNEVEYVGPRIDGMLRTYMNATSFLAGLRRGRYDLVVVGRRAEGLPGEPRGADYVRWIQAAGGRAVVTSRELALFVPPPGSPKTAG